jgi:hypothetical protein
LALIENTEATSYQDGLQDNERLSSPFPEKKLTPTALLSPFETSLVKHPARQHLCDCHTHSDVSLIQLKIMRLQVIHRIIDGILHVTYR